jgi:YgiT-type zinc finger domain-containing protein
MIKNCPICGGRLNYKAENKEFQYRGHSFVVVDYEMMECGNCGEGILDSKLMGRNEAKIKDHHCRLNLKVSG